MQETDQPPLPPASEEAGLRTPPNPGRPPPPKLPPPETEPEGGDAGAGEGAATPGT